MKKTILILVLLLFGILVLGADWTVGVYICADNNLEAYASGGELHSGIYGDVNEMEMVGSDTNVHIIVEIDKRTTAYTGWETAKRFYIEKDADPNTITSPELEDLGEINMGHPNTLTSFINYLINTSTFSSTKYALIIWNHGSGWERRVSSYDVPRKWICEDVTSNDVLTVKELKTALENSAKPPSGKFDVLAFDACFMQMLEVLYEIQDYAEVIVASEESEPAFGYPYHTIFNDLINTPGMTSSEFGEVIAQDYVASYDISDYSTQSAVYSDSITGVITALDNFALELISCFGTNFEAINNIRARTQTFDDLDYIDLMDFCNRINSKTSFPPKLRSAANALVNSLDNTIIYSGNTGGVVRKANGISIYYPTNPADYIVEYNSTRLANDTHWDEFIKRDFSYGDDFSNIIVYPNPCFISKSEYVIIENIPLNSELKIFTISGGILHSVNTGFQSTYFWKTKNKYGNIIASGVYLINVKKNGKSTTRKLVIIK
ncbi:T9SS type A sorting domain-containing protein [Candidatus Dependentiae bacterium]|nr:T9SS type A sorting domain-containing protein [Candidatus Dependentiae bacterium]